MKLSALTLILGIVTLLYLASAQSRPATAATPPCPSGLAGPFNVYLLGPKFDPTAANPTYASPTSTTILTLPPPATPTPSAMVADLSQAFAIAPQSILKQLCGLDGIFVNTNDCNPFDYTADVCSGSLTPKQVTEDSWGYREGPWQFPPSTPPGHYGRYIAISAGPWSTATSHAPPYSGYEQMLLNQLLPWPSGATPPAYGAAASADTPAMAVLAALAHELGHVLWYDNFRPTAGGPYDFDTFCDGTFFAGSWRHVDQPPLWRQFGAPQNSHVLSDPNVADNVADIALALVHRNPGLAADLLHRIYMTKGRWASLFAAFSPDEDFVETFKFYVLTKTTTPLTSLPITITAQQIAKTQPPDDIPKDYTNNLKRLLSRKVTCVQQAYP
jgi:hypothetical protein